MQLICPLFLHMQKAGFLMTWLIIYISFQMDMKTSSINTKIIISLIRGSAGNPTHLGIITVIILILLANVRLLVRAKIRLLLNLLPDPGDFNVV